MRRHRTRAGCPWEAAALALFLAGSSVTLADPPNLMRYQARLTSGAGTPIAGNHSFTFSIFGQVTGGTALWTEGPRTIQVPSGDLNVLLGELTPIPSSVMNQSDRWLEIVVDGTPLAPRNRLSSVPYSFSADRLGTKTLGEMQSDNDARYPGLNNANTFAGNQHVNGDLSATGRGTFQGGTNDHLMDVTQSGSGSALRATAGSVGAHGVATGASGVGVKGEGMGAGGVGVRGDATDGTGVHGNATGAQGVGARGSSSGVNGAGVKGEATGTGGSGVHGSAADGAGAGVKGENAAANGVGVKGEGMGAGGVGVRGDATDGSGVHGNATGALGVGARGSSSGPNGAGVKGEATGAGGSGVHGSAADGAGAGVNGENVAANGVGVKGEGMGAGGVGVRGDATDGSGVHGNATVGSGVHGNATGAQGIGARGSSSGANGAGVKGEATGAGGSGVHGSAADGAGAGVKGENAAANGVGVKGEGMGAGGVGVRGDATDGAGVQGNSTDGSGVHGNATGALGVGARGSSSGANGAGVKGQATGAGGSGVHGEATGTGAGVMGKSENASGTAGLFDNTVGGRILSGQAGGAEKFAVDGGGNVNAMGAIEAAGQVRGGQVHSLATQGTAPLVVASTTQVLNLNCDLLDGLSAADLAPATGSTAYAPATGSTAYAPATGSTAYVSRTGDTLSGALVLPADGLTAGATQLVLSSGRVGIGTATPGVSLDVNGTTRTSTMAAVTFTSAGSGQAVQVAAPSGSPGANVTVQGGFGASSGNAGGSVTIQGGAGNGAGAGGNIVLLPGTGGSQGNVGIGTSTPGATLDVNGTARAMTMAAVTFTSAAGSGQAVQVTAPSGSPGANVTIQGGGGASSGNGGGDVTIQGGAGNGTGVGGSIILLPGLGGSPGNVGIGTMMPGATLDVNGTARAAIMAAATFTSVGPGENVLVQAPSGSPGAKITLTAGSGASPGNAGGDVKFEAGAGNGFGAGGDIILVPGIGGTGGSPGTVFVDGPMDVQGPIKAQSLQGEDGIGLLEIKAQGGSPPGQLILRGGNASGGSGDNGGDITIYPGRGDTIATDNNGNVIIDLGIGQMAAFQGKIGINDATPNNILTVQQGSATDPIADQWTTYSSRRWKTNIEPIVDPLEMLLRLRGVSFDWKDGVGGDLGLIAEEVGEVLPGIVQYEANGVDARGLDYSRLVPLLVEAIKAQQGEIEKLKERLRSLGSR